MTIQVDDIKTEYTPIRKAKQMSGLRIVLGASNPMKCLLAQKPRKSECR